MEETKQLTEASEIEQLEQQVVPEKRKIYTKDNKLFVELVQEYDLEHAKKVGKIFKERQESAQYALNKAEELKAEALEILKGHHQTMVDDIRDKLSSIGNDEFVQKTKNEMFNEQARQWKEFIDNQEKVLEEATQKTLEQLDSHLFTLKKQLYDNKKVSDEWDTALRNE